jgi:hypothetical protein
MLHSYYKNDCRKKLGKEERDITAGLFLSILLSELLLADLTRLTHPPTPPWETMLTRLFSLSVQCE